MDQYNREEGRYDRDEPGTPEPQASSAPREFPWSDDADATPPTPDRQYQPTAAQVNVSVHGGEAVGSGTTEGNGIAIAGFVLSIVSLIPIPIFNIICWILAVVFSSIGLSRANKQGRPHRGLAIAGLSISLAALVLIVLMLIFIGLAVTTS